MPRAPDFACALLTAPALVLLAIVVAAIAALLGGEPAANAAAVAGFAAFVVLPPVTIVLRARAQRLRLDWACLLLCLTLVSMAATFTALILAQAFAYAWLMRDFQQSAQPARSRVAQRAGRGRCACRVQDRAARVVLVGRGVASAGKPAELRHRRRGRRGRG